MIRIVAGKYRHLIIKQPNVDTTRPTMDKVREAIMSSIGYHIEDTVVLDLFAGSGAMGLESLSRGARKAIFVDTNNVAISTIKDNIRTLKIQEETQVLKMDYKSFLESLNEKIDILILDPPYKMKEVYQEIVNFMLEKELLSENGIIIKECDKPFEEDERFKKCKSYKYGQVHVQVLWR